ncbi:hypothetical protein GQX74_012531 [Glossina fuscipes]|nr:hypothetical protein GQX74_012531 [Glossina fuscipes]
MPAKTGIKGTPQGAQAARRETPEAFKRSTRIQRSPEQLVGNHTQVRSQSSPPILQEKTLMRRKGENSFVELEEKIGELIEMMAPTPSAPARRTIHQPMRDLVDMLAVLHKKAEIELGSQMAKKGVKDGTTQPEKGGRVNATKRLREVGSADTIPAKKSKRTGDGINPNNAVPKKPKQAKEEWTVVQAKNRRAKPIKLVNKPDAIKQTGTMSYSDMLKKVKNDAELQKVGENPKNTERRNAAGIQAKCEG